MSTIDSSKSTLRLFGDNLDPDEITRLLGKRPTKSERKGDKRIGRVTGNESTVRTGSWRLEATIQSPGNFDEQIREILADLTDDFAVWLDLTSNYHADIFCGVFMSSSNDGISLGSKTMLLLGERGLTIGFDIYAKS